MTTAPAYRDGTQSQALTLSRPPVILQVLPALDTGGVERGAVDIARAVVDAGGKAVVASEGGRLCYELERIGAEHVTLPLASKNLWTLKRNVGRLKELAQRTGAHLIHARSRAPAWSARAAARQLGLPYVTTFHGAYSGWSTPIKKQYNAIMAAGDEVIAISDFIADHIRRYYPAAGDRITVIPRGINFEIFDPDKVSAERLVKLSTQWRLSGEEQVVMLPGRLTRWKGQCELIEAMALVVARLGRRNLRCLLVGGDQGRTGYRSELEALIKKRDLKDIVHIVDHCDDMSAAYMLTDAVVSASNEPEAFGRVAVEGQAMGRPVIATAHGGSKETVLPGETGWLVHPKEPKLLADAIAQVLSVSDTRRGVITERAVAHVRAKYSLEQMRAKTLDVYERALSRIGA